jgi:glycosyltransferase involved in cell wall biosynthesis
VASDTRPPPSVSVVVPVYNGAAVLPALVEQLETVLGVLTAWFEVILVNDGSHDKSWDVIRNLVARHAWIRGVHLMRNYGQHNALLAGIAAARGEIIVTMDDDLQHPPDQIPKLLAKLAEGYDVVYGTPDTRQHDLGRAIAARITKFALQSTMGAAIARNVSAFRAVRAEVCEAFAEYRSPFVCIDVLLTWGTTRFAAVVVRHDPRRVGPSNYTLGKLIVHALNMTTGFSTLPLQLASIVGFAFTFVGLGVFGFVLGRYAFQGGSVPGFPFLASIIAMFSGAQLFALGILGEYLARMHFRMMERPPYVVAARAESRERGAQRAEPR